MLDQERAKQHVEAGRRIIAAQLSLIEELKAQGRDTALAESLLDSFRHTQEHYEQDLRRFMRPHSQR
jgi:hypothetical protein